MRGNVGDLESKDRQMVWDLQVEEAERPQSGRDRLCDMRHSGEYSQFLVSAKCISFNVVADREA